MLTSGRLLFLFILVHFALLKPASAGEHVNKQPNFLWILTEDSSKDYFKLYSNQGAETPNIEALARNGMIFDNAFSNAPVCSVARSMLATGAYATRIGTQYHRAWDYADLPDNLIPISKMLMDAGYYVTNNYKTDYNFPDASSYWHSTGKTANWSSRQKKQAFFHMQTIETTHSSRLHYPEGDVDSVKTRYNPDIIKVAPIYPDTEVIRYSYARYLDKVSEADIEVGKIIKQLEKEGELENTFIFFFGDHGGPLPGSKGYLYERGLNPPLVIRIPQNFKHLLHKDMQHLKNKRIDGFVNFIDFAPTLAKLAHIPTSTEHDGEVFLGANISLSHLNMRQTTFASADRFDERSSLTRSIRHKNFKYIRQYEPLNPDSLFNFYRFKQPAYKEWAKFYADGKLNDVQSAYFKPKSIEALYDLRTDPFETRNIANIPTHRATLISMREMLITKLKSLPDVGFIPESELLLLSKGSISKIGKKHKSDIAELVDIANLQLQPFFKVKDKIENLLHSDDVWKKYWALIVVNSFEEQDLDLSTLISQLQSSDNHPLIRSRAIQYLASKTSFKPEEALLNLISETTNDLQVVEILNVAAQLKDKLHFTLNIPNNKRWMKPSRDDPDFFRKNSKFGMIHQRLLFLRGEYD